MPQSRARIRGLLVHLAASAVSCCLAANLDAQTLLNTDPGPGATADAATIGGAPVTIYAYRANM